MKTVPDNIIIDNYNHTRNLSGCKSINYLINTIISLKIAIYLNKLFIFTEN